MMRVGQRLFLAVLPAILGVFTVAGLAYWGNYARQAPEWLIGAAVVAAVVSLIVAWRNARYVAHRIEQLAARRSALDMASDPVQRAARVLGERLSVDGDSPGMLDDAKEANGIAQSTSVDELDTIEEVVHRLTVALTSARDAQAQSARVIEQQQREYGTLVASTVTECMHQLEEVRLPLHILLENHFGDLNENQEEMLGAARTASEAADRVLMRMRDIVQLDLREVTLRRERIRLADVMATILPPLSIAAGDRQIVVQADLPPTLPLLMGDRGRLQEAFSNILSAALRRTPEGGRLGIDAASGAGVLTVVVRGATGARDDDELTLAGRLVTAHGGTLDDAANQITVRLPTPTPV